MDNEGHKSQQDVVGEVKKHPWEEKPEVVVPTSESERAEHAKINDLEKKKARRAKRAARKEKFVGFIKGHKKAIIITIVTVILLVAGIVTAIILLNQSKEGGVGNGEGNEVYGFPEDMTVEKAPTPDYAFNYVKYTSYIIATSDIVPEGSSTPDVGKLEDQMREYINYLDSEYEQFFYKLYLPILVASFGEKERAQVIMDENKPLFKIAMDEKQKYAYYDVMRLYYLTIHDDANKAKEFEERLNKEFPVEYQEREWCKNKEGCSK